MAGSTYGNIFRVTTWGESHGYGIGAVIDGCPAGLEIDENYIQQFLDRRKPGQSTFATPRNEADSVSILSGVFNGKTTGTPISLMIKNTDYRGGGRSSGRETAARVAAGAIAIKALEAFDIHICAYVSRIGDVSIDYENIDLEEAKNNALCMPDKDAYEKASEYLKGLMSEKESQILSNSASAGKRRFRGTRGVNYESIGISRL